jgi:hypothetical protein
MRRVFVLIVLGVALLLWLNPPRTSPGPAYGLPSSEERYRVEVCNASLRGHVRDPHDRTLRVGMRQTCRLQRGAASLPDGHIGAASQRRRRCD